MCTRPSRALIQSYFHPAYSACFTRANLSKPHCEGMWGPHAAWPALRMCFYDVFGSARASVVHPGGLVFAQTDGGAHLCRLQLSGGELQNENGKRRQTLECTRVACFPFVQLTNPCQPSNWVHVGCSGRWCGVETFPFKNGIVVRCVTLADMSFSMWIHCEP